LRGQLWARGGALILPPRVALGGEPFISNQRWWVPPWYLLDFRDHLSKISRPRCAPPLTAKRHSPQAIHSSRLRSGFGMHSIISAIWSRSMLAGGAGQVMSPGSRFFAPALLFFAASASTRIASVSHCGALI